MPPKQSQKGSQPKAAKSQTDNNPAPPQCNIPEHEIKQNSGVSASMALQAGQKAWEYRQAAHGAADAKVREELLAKAINKEIEAESFGKAAKYTQSGAFQGLAAGAGLGVQPGVTIGKLTGALVGGVVSTVTGLLGGGIGSVYGAMSGPFWDLGEMASHGVQSIVGDFLPDVKATSSQKKALEKMIMQTRETQAPTKEELEQMKNDMPDQMPQSWSQSVKDMTSWRPKMPSMPSMPSAKGVGGAMGLGGIGASMNPWGEKKQEQQQQQKPQQQSAPRRQQQQQQQNQQPAAQNQQVPAQPQQPSQAQSQRPAPASRQPSKQGNQQNGTQSQDSSQEQAKPEKPRSQRPPTTRGPANPQPTQQSQPSTTNTQPQPTQQKQPPKPQQSSNKPATNTQSKPSQSKSQPSNTSRPPLNQSKRVSFNDEQENGSTTSTQKGKRKPRKLNRQTQNGATSKGTTNAPAPATKKTPRKLESRKPAT